MLLSIVSNLFIYFRSSPFTMAGHAKKPLDSQEKRIFIKIVKETDGGKVCTFLGVSFVFKIV